MADEAIVTIVARMRDEASPKMSQLGKTTETSQMTMANFRMTLVAVGSALTAVGSLLGKMDNPAAKMASNFLLISGAMTSTVGAIFNMIPMIRQLITWLRTLAITQAIVKSLAGPVGWAQLGIGLGVAAAATAGIVAATGGFGGKQGATIVNINAQAFTGSRADARKFGSQIKQIQVSETRLGR